MLPGSSCGPCVHRESVEARRRLKVWRCDLGCDDGVPGRLCSGGAEKKHQGAGREMERGLDGYAALRDEMEVLEDVSDIDGEIGSLKVVFLQKDTVK